MLRTHWRAASVALAVLGLVSTAKAGEFVVAASAGTLGVGGQAGYEFNDYLAARVAAQGLTYGIDGEEAGVNYDADLELGSVGAYVDWHPFAGRFRVTTGWFANDNGVSGVGVPDAGGNYDVAGNTFTSAQVGTLQASADFDNSAPYLGLGWQFGGDAGFGVTFDVGAYFQGSPDFELTSVGGTESGNPLLLNALDQEEADYEDEVSSYDVYPVAQLALTYRF